VFRHIRSKLIAAFAVPLAILVAVAGLEAVSSLGQINSVDQETSLASASVGPGGVVQALQTERIYAVLSIFTATEPNALAPSLQGLTPASDGLYQNVAKLEAQTNIAISSFQSTVRGAGHQAELIYAQTFQELGTLDKTRAYWAKAGGVADAITPVPYISKYAKLVSETYQGYTNIIDALEGGTAGVPLKISDPTLRTGVEALYTSLEGTESQWQVVEDLFNAAMSNGSAQKTQIQQALQDYGADLAWAARLNSYGSGAFTNAIYNENQSSVNQSIELDVGFMGLGQVPPMQSVLQAFTEPACVRTASEKCLATTVTPTAFGEGQIATVVNSKASSLRTSAVEQAITFGAVGALGTVLGLLLVIMVSRSVSRPLVDLARQADELATTTLPATVKAILDAGAAGTEMPKVPKVSVTSRDEVAGMARALEAVNKTAVEMAAGQAALRRNLADAFVNLGRRNQNLVTRQLEYISEIELKEADPESLEELFRLDHLATRMRRNAESLLILAGSGPARHWSSSVPAMDVARAASAEVEDYKRLRLHHFDPAQITGGVTTDLVHIMAELIENALTFSPPGSPVDVYGRFLEGGYVIVIVDSGIGMSADDLETANRRLEGQGSDGEVPGRYLGHFVAGRLASRHDIAISLQASHSGGLVARVKIPALLIEDPVPDLSAVAEVRSAPTASASAPAPAPEADPVVIASSPVEAMADGHAPSVDHHGASLNGGPVANAGGFGPSSNGYGDNHLNGSHPAGSAENADEALAQWAGEMGAPARPGDADAAGAPQDSGYADEDNVEVPAETVAQLVDEANAVVQDEGYQYEPPATDVEEATDDSVAEPETDAEIPEDSAVDHDEEVDEAGPEAPGADGAGPVRATGAAASVPATPDLGILSPLAATTEGLGSGPAAPPPSSPTPAETAKSSAAAWNSLPVAPVADAADVGPATQARSTADGLRKLTRRVPGASLPVEDDSLRRATPTSTSKNPLGLNGALSQYLSATANEGRPEKEHNAR
jgi:signal transduction histidine kinase